MLFSSPSQTYDFKVQHKKGKENGNADGLSRQPCLKNTDKYRLFCPPEGEGNVMQWSIGLDIIIRTC